MNKNTSNPDAIDTIDTIDTAKFGRKYYDILDVLSNKLMSSIVENSSELNINKEELKKLNKIVKNELVQARGWGFDQLISIIKG
jgi:hypothetical protein